MNYITRSVGFAGQWQPARRSSLKLPVYVRLEMVVFVVMAAIIIGQVFQLRLTTQPSNPFTGYEAISPGQPRSAVIALGFSCAVQYAPSERREYCTRLSVDSPFSLITVTLWDEVVKWTDFTVSEGVLTAGDLAYMWGKPRVMIYGTSANFDWPDAGAKARGQAVNGKFSYFIPLHHISLGSQSEE